MCIEPVAGCATMSYLPSLYCLRSSICGTCAFAPDRPVLLAAPLDGEAHHGLWIDAVHAARLFFRRMALERIAEDQQTFGRRALQHELAVLETLLPCRAVVPRLRAIGIRRPKQAAATAFARLHCIGPKAQYHCAVGFAHASPACARIFEIHPARFETRAAPLDPPPLGALRGGRSAPLHTVLPRGSANRAAFLLATLEPVRLYL